MFEAGRHVVSAPTGPKGQIAKSTRLTPSGHAMHPAGLDPGRPIADTLRSTLPQTE